MSAVIQTNNLTKTYHETKVPVHALNGVSLEVAEGEFTSLVGPSGSGKTTLLNVIGGLDTATSGSVMAGGKDITAFSPNKLISFRLHNIGFVFQAFNLVPVLTARENAEFIMLLQGWPQKDREERVQQLMEEVGLADRMDSKPNELSGGQQQRVAVVRALASRPRFVLADEPTANLDGDSARNLLDIMARLNREENMTFIFSTHDHRVIERARRVVTLEDGKIVDQES